MDGANLYILFKIEDFGINLYKGLLDSPKHINSQWKALSMCQVRVIRSFVQVQLWDFCFLVNVHLLVLWIHVHYWKYHKHLNLQFFWAGFTDLFSTSEPEGDYIGKLYCLYFNYGSVCGYGTVPRDPASQVSLGMVLYLESQRFRVQYPIRRWSV